MSLSQQFSKEYALLVKQRIDESTTSSVLDLRNRLQSTDMSIKKKAEEELIDKIVDGDEPLNHIIKAFFKLDFYARQLFKGRFNRIGEEFQHTFLRDFIQQHSNIKIEFLKKKKININGHEVHYVIMNKLNNYDTNFEKKWTETKHMIPTILICAGNASNGTYNELKSKNINNLQVFNIDEFVEWLKQN